MADSKECMLIEYIQEQAQNFDDFCTRNGITEFSHAGYTFFPDKGDIKVYVTMKNDNKEFSYKVTSKWKIRGKWGEIETTP